MSTTTDRLFDAIGAVEFHWRGDVADTDDVVELWADAEYALRQLGQVVKLIADDAAGRLLDRDDPMADYVTRHGDVVHLASGYAPERWRGRELAQRLGRPLIDAASGEVVDAVPVLVLLDVLPGVADYDATSSKWRTTGLRRHLPDWHRYRSRDEAPLVIRRGGRP